MRNIFFATNHQRLFLSCVFTVTTYNPQHWNISIYKSQGYSVYTVKIAFTTKHFYLNSNYGIWYFTKTNARKHRLLYRMRYRFIRFALHYKKATLLSTRMQNHSCYN
eukprot:NODE_630_length_5791_cov_0.338370.p4 type:complete len:107 gc:universal NODE_630_length_5791_cov_0.338370:4896-5216(+)